MKLPHNLKSIGRSVFSNCGRLCGTLELPASVSCYRVRRIYGMTNLRAAGCGNKITNIEETVLGAE